MGDGPILSATRPTGWHRLGIATVASCLLLSACGSGGETNAGDPAQADNATSADSDDATATTGGPIESVVTTQSTSPEPVEMPDLLGMTEAEARSSLVEMGLDEPTIDTSESFEPAGTVLEQIPSAGRVVTGTISIVVADAIAPVPDFVGEPIASVRAWTEPRGIEIREQQKLVTDSVTGTVLEQLPAAGAAANEELVVTVAEAPVIVDLANLEPVDQTRYCYYVEDVSIAGDTYLNAATLKLSPRSTCGHVSFDLSKDWSSLRFKSGLDDRLSANASVQLEIFGDSQLLYSEVVSFNQVTDVEVDVTDVLRLDITVALLSGGETRLGLANAELLGGTGASTE